MAGYFETVAARAGYASCVIFEKRLEKYLAKEGAKAEASPGAREEFARLERNQNDGGVGLYFAKLQLVVMKTLLQAGFSKKWARK